MFCSLTRQETVDKNLNLLLEALLPEGILYYFELTDASQTEAEISIYLEEKNIAPAEHQHKKLHAKDFLPPVAVQDFPIRRKKVTLFVKRRRWEVVGTNEIVTRDWEIVKKGTRMTMEFAAFLKGLLR
nr:transposase [Chitinophaga sp. sic0106]